MLRPLFQGHYQSKSDGVFLILLPSYIKHFRLFSIPVVAVSDPKLNTYVQAYCSTSTKPTGALLCPQRRGVFRVKSLCFPVRPLLGPSGLPAITGSR